MTTACPTLPASTWRDFRLRHGLPETFEGATGTHYLQLLSQLAGHLPAHRPLLLGINGAQGTGKSTLADFLAVAGGELNGWTVAVLSLDDFYLTRQERRHLADAVHPMLRTRGVPGTHDTALLGRCLDRLHALADGETLALPRFDKRSDDRSPTADWPIVNGPVDLIVLEGWCVGSSPQPEDALVTPVNDLERHDDGDGRWRRYVNEALRRDYATLFARLDLLVFLQAPSFDAILRWRREQEHKLIVGAGAASRGVMDDAGIGRFVQYFERLTRANLDELPGRADVVLRLDEAHEVTGMTCLRR